MRKIILNGPKIRSLEYLTTGQVAKICGVASKTVVAWYDQGRVQGYKIPGSRTRKVSKESLVKYLRNSDYPVPQFLCQRMLIYGAGPIMPIEFKSNIFDFEPVKNFFHLGQLVQMELPSAVVFDFALGRSESIQVSKVVRDKGVKYLVAIANEDEDEEKELKKYFNKIYRKPCHIANVLLSLQFYEDGK